MRSLIVVLVALFAFVGCGSSSSTPTDNQVDSNDSELVVPSKKSISFFAWDGVDGIDSVSERLDGYEAPTIYLNPVDNGKYKFEENAQKVQESGGSVWFLMSANPTLDYVQEQVDKIVEYNSNHTEKVIGMSFDIEPWVDFAEQNSSDNIGAWEDYLEFMSDARDMLHKKDLNISIAIPFWIDRQTQAEPNDRPINYDVIDIADEVIVMTYTTYIDRIESYAKSSLEYAQEMGKDIKIAFEMIDYDAEDNVSFYTHPEDIKEALDVKLDYSTFKGYMIHTLEAFIDSNISL